MRFVLIRMFLAMLVLLAFPGHALPADGVVRATLRNGLRVVIVRNSLAPVVTTEINYLVGANESPADFPGMAHAQEHMMFRGSPGLSGQQLSTIIASLGGDFNADTQQTVTQYFFTVPADDVDIALHLEATRMRGVLDTERLWDQERGAIDQEVAQDLSNPIYIFSTRLLRELYAGTPYSRDGLGTRESFQKTTGSMLKKFYETWYAPNNAVLVIVGNVDSRRVLAKVKELFEPIPGRPLPPRPEVKLRPLKPAALNIDTDLPYGMAVVTYRLPGFDSPDFAAGQILADVLDSHLGRLYDLVIQGKALSAGFDSDPLPKAASGYAVAAFPRGGDGASLLKEMKSIIDSYIREGFSERLVEAAKRHEIADAEFQKNSVPGLATLWSMAVAVEGRSSPEDDIAALRKVTVADVNRIAREYLTNGNAITAILTPKASGAPVTAKEFKGPESFTPRQVKPVELPAWAKKVTSPPALGSLHEHPADITLPNGLRLIVQPEKVSGSVSVYGQVKTNPVLQEPRGQDGVSRVMESLFSYGSGSYDRVAFQRALDDIGAELSPGTGFSLRVLADRFDHGMQLLADNLLNPAFPAQAFEIVKKQTAGAVEGELESPSSQVVRELRKMLYPANDPKKREPNPRAISRLTLGDVRSYYHSVFRPDLATIVVIGDVTADQARAVVEKYFGHWTASGPKPQTDLPPVPLNRPGGALVPDASRVQDEVRLAEILGLTRSNPDYYPLQVGNHILSGAFYATRLYRDLRERAGLVYAVESEMEIGKTRSIFGVFYACDPDNVAKAKARVEGDLRAMRTVPVTAEELRLAKALLVRQVPLARSSVDGIAVEMLKLVQDGLPLDEPRRAAERYVATTAEDVRAAFSKWIRPDGFVQVTLGPAAK